ncbi:MAG: hypothetical protein JXB49_09255 [Bacteroidales bacterium]|nr:hypothetical protein [Bacteroidales bacterium]
MKLLPLILLTSVILILLLAAFSFRLFIDKNAKLPGGSCQNRSQDLQDKGLGCSCGGAGGSECKNKD